MGTISISQPSSNTLTALADTLITAITDNEILQYDNGSSTWINQTLAEAGISATGHTHTESDITDLQAYLLNTTDTFTGTLDIIGNAGIGIARTEGTLHVHTATAGAVTASSSADDLVVENSANGGLSILVPDASQSFLIFGSPADAAGAVIKWDYTGDLFHIGSDKSGADVRINSGAGVEAMRVESTGNVNIGLGATAADGTLHVYTGSAGAVTADGNADDLIVENSASGGLSILTPDASQGQLVFGNPGDPFAASVLWDYTNDLYSISTHNTGASMRFRTDNGVIAMTIDSSQNVGIGTDSPDTKLHVHNGTAGAITALNNTVLTLENNTHTYLSFLSPNTSDNAILFGDSDNNAIGSIVYEHSTNLMRFATSGGVAAYITSTGEVGIGTSAPDGTLHVHTASAGSVTANSNSDDFVVEHSANCGITILSPDANDSGLYFGSPSDNIGSRMFWNYNAGEFVFGTATTGAELRINSDNGVEAMRIDSNGNVGIGISTPDGKLHVMNASAGSVTASSSGDDLVIENSASGGLSILVPDASDANMYFGSPTDAAGGRFQWNYSTGLMRMITSKTGGQIAFETDNNAEAMRIDASQNVGIGTGATVSGKTHVDQSSATGAIPVLYLDQADVSEEFIRFDATEATGNSVEAVGAKTLTTTKFLRINVNGTDLYMQVGTIA